MLQLKRGVFLKVASFIIKPGISLQYYNVLSKEELPFKRRTKELIIHNPANILSVNTSVTVLN